jgi:hypothetical protein
MPTASETTNSRGSASSFPGRATRRRSASRSTADASRNAEKLREIALEARKPHGLAAIGPGHIRRIEGDIRAYRADLMGPKIQPPLSASSSVVRSVAHERCHVAFWIEAL